jgi:hypothetical protein
VRGDHDDVLSRLPGMLLFGAFIAVSAPIQVLVDSLAPVSA